MSSHFWKSLRTGCAKAVRLSVRASDKRIYSPHVLIHVVAVLVEAFPHVIQQYDREPYQYPRTDGADDPNDSHGKERRQVVPEASIHSQPFRQAASGKRYHFGQRIINRRPSLRHTVEEAIAFLRSRDAGIVVGSDERFYPLGFVRGAGEQTWSLCGRKRCMRSDLMLPVARVCLGR